MVLGLIKSCLGRKRLDCRVIQDDASARYPSVPQKWRKLVQYFTKSHCAAQCSVRDC
jgi:hypothetical protein